MQFHYRIFFLHSFHHLNCTGVVQVGTECLVKQGFLCAVKFSHNTQMFLSKAVTEQFSEKVHELHCSSLLPDFQTQS